MNGTTEHDAARLFWVDAVRQLRDLSAGFDRLRRGAGQEDGPFTAAQLRSMGAGIERARDAVEAAIPS